MSARIEKVRLVSGIKKEQITGRISKEFITETATAIFAAGCPIGLLLSLTYSFGPEITSISAGIKPTSWINKSKY